MAQAGTLRYGAKSTFAQTNARSFMCATSDLSRETHLHITSLTALFAVCRRRAIREGETEREDEIQIAEATK